MRARPVDSIAYKDWVNYPVWEFASESEEQDETYILPCTNLPVKDLDGRLLSCSITLANGNLLHGVLGNINTNNPENNIHFVTLSVVKPNKTFHLSRYFDFDYSQYGPEALAKFLQLPLSEVFPISYTIDAGVLIGASKKVEYINVAPEKKPSKAEIIKLAVG